MVNNVRDYSRIIRAVFLEELSNDYKELAEDEYENWNPESVMSGYEDSGRLHEIVDGCVPVYNSDIVELWLDCNMPEAEDYGGENSGTIIQQMMAGLYYWADEYAHEWFEDFHYDAIHGTDWGKSETS